jgi:hypothetical protein
MENKRKIVFIGANYFADGYRGFGREFIENGWLLNFFPLFTYYKKKGRQIKDICDFCLGENVIEIGEKYESGLIQYESGKADIVIWFHSRLQFNKKEFEILKNIDCHNILYNWDPFSYDVDHPSWNNNLNFKILTMKFMDKVFTVLPNEVKYFADFKINYLETVLQPASSQDFQFYHDADFECEVSCVITNCYTDFKEFPSQLINRRDLLDFIYHKTDIKLHVYGMPFLKAMYPNAYRGFVSYQNAKKVFSNSMVNLNISPVGDKYKVKNLDGLYFSERVPQILASRGLLVAEQDLSPLLVDGKSYIHIKFVEQIVDIVDDIKKNRAKYVGIRNRGFAVFKNKLEWSDFYFKHFHEKYLLKL